MYKQDKEDLLPRGKSEVTVSEESPMPSISVIEERAWSYSLALNI
jgi:hypothetical protein